MILKPFSKSSVEGYCEVNKSDEVASNPKRIGLCYYSFDRLFKNPTWKDVKSVSNIVQI